MRRPSWCGGSFPSAAPPVGSALPGRSSSCLSNSVQDPCHRIQPVGRTVTCVSRPFVRPAQPVGQHDRRPGLLAAQPVVVVVVRRDVDRQRRDGLHAVPCLVGDDRLGHELVASADEQRPARPAVTDSHVDVEPSSACAPRATPRPRPRARPRNPARAHRRLELEAGEVVVLAARADRQGQPLRDERDFVLRERRQQRGFPRGRHEHDRRRRRAPPGRGGTLVRSRRETGTRRPPAACAGRSPSCTVLHVEVPRAAILLEEAGHAAEGAVVVRLHLQLGPGRRSRAARGPGCCRRARRSRADRPAPCCRRSPSPIIATLRLRSASSRCGRRAARAGAGPRARARLR